MSMKPENRFINALNDRVPIKKRRGSAAARARHPGPGIHYEKMNNPYSAGTADSWYSGPRGDLWIEFKYLPKTPIRADVDPSKLLSSLQLEWLNHRHDEGRNVAVIIGSPDGGVLMTNKSWENTISAREFHSLLRSKDELANWIIGQTN